jgi:hypothetical protein
VGLFDHAWDRFWRRMDGLDDEEWRWAPTADPRISLRWRLGHIRRLLSEDRNGAWLGRPAEPTGLASRKAAGAAASLADLRAAFTWWRELVASLDDEALNTPLGEAAGYFADATGRAFVLHSPTSSSITPPRPPCSATCSPAPACARSGGGPWPGCRTRACRTSGGWRSC